MNKFIGLPQIVDKLFLICCLDSNKNLLILSVTDEETSDGFKRFHRSARVNNLPVEVVADADVKINTPEAIRHNIELHQDDPEKIVLIINGNAKDVLLAAEEEKILERFFSFKSRIVFSAQRKLNKQPNNSKCEYR